MRILVLGAGATGGYFGGRLVASGTDVTFLVRERRARQLAASGIVIKSPFGDDAVIVKFVTTETLAGTFDAILLGCKSYDLSSAIEAIAPAIGENAVILPLLNGMRHLDDLDAAFGARRVLGGMCHLSVDLEADGTVRHLNTLHVLTFGPRSPEQAEICRQLQAIFAGAHFTAKLSQDVTRDMWGKWVLLAALAGMTCTQRASVGDIAATEDGAALMREAIDECAEIAADNSNAASPESLAMIKSLLTDPKSAVVASMLRDMQRGRPIECEHIIGDMLARAGASRDQKPLLRMAYANLQAYERQRKLAVAAAK